MCFGKYQKLIGLLGKQQNIWIVLYKILEDRGPLENMKSYERSKSSVMVGVCSLLQTERTQEKQNFNKVINKTKVKTVLLNPILLLSQEKEQKKNTLYYVKDMQKKMKQEETKLSQRQLSASLQDDFVIPFSKLKPQQMTKDKEPRWTAPSVGAFIRCLSQRLNQLSVLSSSQLAELLSVIL